jgi:hypothetical protein
VTVGTGNSVSVRKLAQAMGMGHLPVVEDTPGERMDNQADISKLLKIGWFPTVNIFDTV